MLTGEVRNKIDKIWTDIWAGGITNPITVIEQLTYLIFIRSLDEKELENEQIETLGGDVKKIFPHDEEGQAWSKFKTYPKTHPGYDWWNSSPLALQCNLSKIYGNR
ncbi:MAG TPA: hypothetical protein DC024_02090 [Clostridiales bacterium]|jgi:type I restriction enzyme M protein|nr:hypothetical protein [Clostridiales bacterium]